ncbi:hypothetical protein OPW33_24935 [Vibrio europaeus]|uniref:hypothetical protein n=1 Tax=Vibrio europaeus TaxID=300876 RepID=UPI0023400C95|nr:hypothetical protein [Vibrio europaeus]MDC5842552.1 hypothetical protein [Vibrio europaeus]
MKTREQVDIYVWMMSGLSGTTLILICLIPTVDMSIFDDRIPFKSLALVLLIFSLPFSVAGAMSGKECKPENAQKASSISSELYFIYYFISSLSFGLGLSSLFFALGTKYIVVFWVAAICAIGLRVYFQKKQKNLSECDSDRRCTCKKK